MLNDNNEKYSLEQALQIIKCHKEKSNSLKNYYLRNINKNKAVTKFLSYLGELEYDLDILNNLISNFQMCFFQKECNFNNEINKLNEALKKAKNGINNLKGGKNEKNIIKNKNGIIRSYGDKNMKIKEIRNNNDKKLNKTYKEFDEFTNFRNYNRCNTLNGKLRELNNNIYNPDNCRRLTYCMSRNEDSKCNTNININDKYNIIDENNNFANKTNNNIIIKKNNANNKNKKRQKKNNYSINLTNNNDYTHNTNKICNNNKNDDIKNHLSSDNCKNNVCINRNKNLSMNNIINNDIQYNYNDEINNNINDRNNNNTNNIIFPYNSIDKNTKNNNIIYSNLDNNISQVLLTDINNNNDLNLNNNIENILSERKNHSSYSMPKKGSIIMNSKRMPKFLNQSNFNRIISEIPKDKDNKVNRINNILSLLSNDEKKLNELKLTYGNNIEIQLVNGDINDEYLNQIENFLYNMNRSGPIIPLSKRFQIHNRARSNSSSKTKKRIKKNDNKNGRMIRLKLRDKGLKNKRNQSGLNSRMDFYNSNNKYNYFSNKRLK